jgi:peptidyl-prolyl cis-trans isomerase B (cyclophilin B)
MKIGKIFFLFAQIFLICIGTLGCVSNSPGEVVLQENGSVQTDLDENESTHSESEELDTSITGNPIVEIEMQDGGIIQLELDRENAPITVENFLSLASSGFYDGLTFHRIEPGFVIQGGDPEGNGMGGSGTNIKGEFQSNGVNNTISHVRGVVSMARSGHPDSASCQFFITLGDASFLDGDYAAFGTVISGMDVADEIEFTPTSGSTPLEPVVMKSVRVLSQ